MANLRSDAKKHFYYPRIFWGLVLVSYVGIGVLVKVLWG